MDRYYCYILKTINPHCNKTYNGYTVNLNRRIRQHNSEITGGARYTTAVSCNNTQPTWEFYVIISGFFTSNEALSFEWWIKHPNGGRRRDPKYTGPLGRLLGLINVLPRLNKYNPVNKYDVWIHSDYISYATAQLRNQPSNVTFKPFKEHSEISKYYDVVDAPVKIRPIITLKITPPSTPTVNPDPVNPDPVIPNSNLGCATDGTIH
jgi:predicted GIY-YIG superfamily endonuclease